MTPAGIAQLKNDEGFRSHAYPDPLSHGEPYTIAWGHTGPDVGPDTTCTEEQGEALLAADIAKAEAGLTAHLPWFASLDPVRQDVLTNIAFNVGTAGLLKWPSTLSYFQHGLWSQASNALLNEGAWDRQVGRRANRCAAATLTGHW